MGKLEDTTTQDLFKTTAELCKYVGYYISDNAEQPIKDIAHNKLTLAVRSLSLPLSEPLTQSPSLSPPDGGLDEEDVRAGILEPIRRDVEGAHHVCSVPARPLHGTMWYVVSLSPLSGFWAFWWLVLVLFSHLLLPMAQRARRIRSSSRTTERSG